MGEGRVGGGQGKADAAGVEVERLVEAAEKLEVRVAPGVDRGEMAGECRFEIRLRRLREDAFARRARRAVEAEQGCALELAFDGRREAAQEGPVSRAELRVKVPRDLATPTDAGSPDARAPTRRLASACCFRAGRLGTNAKRSVPCMADVTVGRDLSLAKRGDVARGYAD
jgi:hypothetical protein